MAENPRDVLRPDNLGRDAVVGLPNVEKDDSVVQNHKGIALQSIDNQLLAENDAFHVISKKALRKLGECAPQSSPGDRQVLRRCGLRLIGPPTILNVN
jgi:hypothetical protein